MVVRKKFKKHCQFRLNLLIKISYIPDIENFDPGIQSYGQKKFFFVVISLKLAKIIEVRQVNFFSKIFFNRFFYNKIRTNQKIYTKFAVSKRGQKSILKKKLT